MVAASGNQAAAANPLMNVILHGKTGSNSMKDQALRALMVDDSEDDVLLILRELKKGGYNPVYERVEPPPP